jgi:hypothetical protein
MRELTDLLRDATAGIGPEYFRLPIHGSGPVYRERVYCYELYHQMRLRWPRNCPFLINGEVDKAAHPILKQLGADRTKPDFLIHQPGDMAGNHAIMEVKSSLTPNRGLRKDISTLSRFLREVGYLRAIYLIYGDGNGETLIKRIGAVAKLLGGIVPIEIWFHTAPYTPAVHAVTLTD